MAHADAPPNVIEPVPPHIWQDLHQKHFSSAGASWSIRLSWRNPLPAHLKHGGCELESQASAPSAPLARAAGMPHGAAP